MSSIRNLLESATNKLKLSDSAALDSEVLLSFVLDKPREYLFAHLDEIVAPDKIEQFNSLVGRRAIGEPIAYLTKQKEFYGRTFFVDERVHSPRPATEDLINCIKSSLPDDFDGTIADIGTGSGCIAITLALEYPLATVIATDISDDALDVARKNARIHNVLSRIKFIKGDLLTPLAKPVDIIVSNPPYGWPNPDIRECQGDVWTSDPGVLFQPRASYDGGKDGLDIIKRLLDELPKYLNNGGQDHLFGGQAFFEFDPRQRKAIDELLANTQFSWQIKKDLSGWDRIVQLKKLPTNLNSQN